MLIYLMRHFEMHPTVQNKYNNFQSFSHTYLRPITYYGVVPQMSF